MPVGKITITNIVKYVLEPIRRRAKTVEVGPSDLEDAQEQRPSMAPGGQADTACAMAVKALMPGTKPM